MRDDSAPDAVTVASYDGWHEKANCTLIPTAVLVGDSVCCLQLLLLRLVLSNARRQLRLNFALGCARTAFNIGNVLENIAMTSASNPRPLLIRSV